MNLPNEILEKLNSLYFELNKKDLQKAKDTLTKNYKFNSGNDLSLICERKDAICYAISRMPSTYCAIKSVLCDLINQGYLREVKSIIDLGSGTGAGFVASKECFCDAKIDLVERDKNMLEIFNFLFDEKVENEDLLKFETDKKFDLVTSAYVLNELSDENKQKALKKMCEISNKYVLIIDAGSPKNYEYMMKLKDIAKELNFSIVAPCKCDKCDLKNDYCQFSVRVERNAYQKMAKDAVLSYEDEKFFYLLFEKDLKRQANENCRIIRKPELKTNQINVKICSNSGVKDLTATKKDKELFKLMKKAKTNEEIKLN